jgi:chlorophyllase
VLFQHGFTVPNRCYEQLLRHVASHGFVVVAPQMYPDDPLPIGKGTTRQEADDVLALLDWLPSHLNVLAGVATDMQRLAIAGHSRGGKVVWRVLQQAVDRLGAAVQIDPTDGTLDGTDEVTRQIASFSLPLLIIGAGPNPAGPDGQDFICTLLGFDHVKFFTVSQAPVWHVVAPYARHADMLDDERSDCGAIPLLCAPGMDPPGMRQLTGGLMVALFRAALQGDMEAWSWLTDSASAPVAISIEAK